MSKSITFNSFSFQDSTFRTEDIIYRNLPSRVIDVEPLSRRDGFRLVNAYYEDKQISISGTITSDTEANLKIAVDNMKRAVNATTANLVIGDGATTMTWVASVEIINIPEKHYSITHLPFNISFKCQPFGSAAAATVSTNSIVNTSSSSGSIVIAGSASPKPIIRWTSVGAPSAAITSISLTNSTTGDTITVPSLTLDGNGEYLEIDVSDMSVVQNVGAGDVEIDFTGIFPRFQTSTNSYTVAIVGGGATRTLLQSITYTAQYL